MHFENAHRGFTENFNFRTNYIRKVGERIELLRKTIFGILFALLSIGVLTYAFNIQSVKASGTIYIRADGSVEPQDAPILNVGNVAYTFMDNIYDPIVIQRDNVIIDGAGRVLHGTANVSGINLAGRSNVTIKNTEIKGFLTGIRIYDSLNNIICGNDIVNNAGGIYMFASSNNIISGNNITANEGHGVYFSFSSNYNSIVGNDITDNWNGIFLYNKCLNNSIVGNNITANNLSGICANNSPNNSIYHNNFVNNTYQVYTSNSVNVWDDGYPSGGNYWSNYSVSDSFNGVCQNVTGSDGIGDTALTIDADNRDRYPLMAPISVFDAGTWNGASYSVDVISNSTVSKFQLNITEKTIKFNVTGETGFGFCRVTIPNVIVQELWHGIYTALINDQPCPFTNWTDTENSYMYFTYQHSEHEVTIMIPEFPQAIILSSFMILFTPIIVFARRKPSRKHET